MPRALGKIAFIVEEFGFDTPAQQLLDRFLIGYPLNGESQCPDCEIHLWMPQDANDQGVRRRIADHPLRRDNSLDGAISQSDGIILVPKGISQGQLLSSILATAPPQSSIYVYGAMGDNLEQARQLASQGAVRQVLLLGGTSTSATWRLPDIDLPRGAKITDALIVVEGEFPLAELHALDGLLPLLERRRGGESGVARVRALTGEDCWKLLSDSDPARDLLAAALSRSDSPLGDPARDGRTQDLLALGLVPKLATSPRAWMIEHTDGLRTVLMVLDGVIRDFNFALRAGDGRIISAQLYRPPAPQRHEFSRLAHVIENYFRSRVLPWSLDRSLLTRQLLDRLSASRDTHFPTRANAVRRKSTADSTVPAS